VSSASLALIIFHVDIKVTQQNDWHILTTSPCQKLKHFAYFWRTPSQVRKYQRFSNHHWEYLEIRTEPPPALFNPFTRHPAA
jgi:hypothetical protein